MASSLALLACLAASQLAHTIFLASRNFSILSVAFTMTRTPAMPTPSAAQGYSDLVEYDSESSQPGSPQTWGGQGNDMSAPARDGRDGIAGIGVRDCEPDELSGQGSPGGVSRP